MNKVYLGISIVLACTILCLGQSDEKRSQQVADPENRLLLMSGATIDAQLQKSVDVKSAKVGDEVVLKVTKSIKQNGEVVIPKGTALIGRITEVQRRAGENSRSKLSLIFGRIQGRELSAPFSASIVSISNVAGQGRIGDSLMTDTSGSSQTSGSVSRSGSGGGLLGGVGNSVDGLVNATNQSLGTVTDTATRTAGSATGTVGRTLAGIQISSSASGSANASSTLSSADKNLRVEKGATFNLRVNGQTAVQE
jgi:hypothetical protein